MKSKRLLWFRLPQTLLKLLGFEDISDVDLMQVPFKDKYSSSGLGMEEASKGLVHFIKEKNLPDSRLYYFDPNLIREILSNYDELIIDLNLAFNMNLNDHLEGFSGTLSILDYAAGPYSPVWSDLSFKNPDALLRALVRSKRLANRIKVDNFYDWTGTVTNSRDNYIPWFWENTPLNFNLFKERCIETLLLISKYDINICTFLEADKKILFLPGNEVTFSDFDVRLMHIIETSRQLSNLDSISPLKVFVKPHRSIKISDLHMNRVFRKDNVIVHIFDSPLTHLLPSEILIHGTEIFMVFSILGTSVFGIPKGKLIGLPSPSTKVELRSYSLAVHRSRKNYSVDGALFPW